MDLRLKTNLLAGLPPAVWIVMFLGVYILLVVPVNYAIFHRFKRVEYAWFALPVVAIAFGLLAYNIGYLRQSRTLDTDEITLVEGVAGSPVAFAKTFLGVYSPSRINEVVRFPEQQVFVRPLLMTGFWAGGRMGPPDSTMARNALTGTYQNGFEVRDFIVHPMAARSLECDYVADLGGQIEADLMAQGDALTGTVTSRLGYALENAMLLLPSGRALSLDRLEPGTTVTVSERTASPDEGFTRALQEGRRRDSGQQYGPGYPGQDPGIVLPLFTPAQQMQGQALFAEPIERLIGQDRCLLIGWARRSLLKPRIGPARAERQLNQRNQTVFHFFHLPVGLALGASNSVERHLWSIEGPTVYSTPSGENWLAHYTRELGRTEWVFMLNTGENTIRIRPRVDLGAREIESLRIELQVDGKMGYRPRQPAAFRWSLYNWSARQWEPVEGGNVFFRPKDAAPYFDRLGSKIELKIEIAEPNAPAGPQSFNPSRNETHYFLRDVAVSATLR